MTSAGRIKHRTKTGINRKTQHWIRRAICQARCLNLLPSASNLRPYHKISLRNLIEDLQDDVAMDVDLETGVISKR